MDDQELEALLRDLESDRTERKESLAQSDRIRQAICAFANDLPAHGRPGVVFVGARDDGSCAGLSITDQLLLMLASMRSDGNIQPFPSLVVQKRTLDGCQMAVVIVEPSAYPPIRVRGVTWIRVGPRRDIATPEEERRLSERRRGRDLPFDIHSLPSAALADLDLDLFQREYLRQAISPEVLAANRRSIEDQLHSLRLLDLDGHPTILGILVLGTDARRFIPGAYVQFLRFDGTRLTDPIRDQKEIDGPLPEMLRRLDEVLEAHNSIGAAITEGPVEVRRPEYPPAALQQLVRNAVLHRTYEATNTPTRIYWFSDRIEIHSPGGAFGQVTAATFGNPGVTDYRNPNVAEAMKVLGYVQRFGVGIPIAREELAKNGNPPLEFATEAAHILALVRRRQ
jgi:ATP-dependent DNA helicase RecG